MVDAAGAYLKQHRTVDQPVPVVHAGPDGASIHAQACKDFFPAPAQHPDWVANWVAHSETDTIVAALHAGDKAVFSLPLEVVSLGAIRAARFMSGPHANGNFPAMSPDSAPLDRETLKALTEQISIKRPDIDVILLERQARRISGQDNPLLQLPHTQSPNPALSVSLDGGFDAVLARANGKRKRKKHRSQTRKFEVAGGWQRIPAETADQIEAMCETFFAMKDARFRALGIKNTFDDSGVKRFFVHLFADAAQQSEPAFALHGLEVGGKLRAITGTSICATRHVCEFSAFADDELAHAAPGDFLFFENIREACESGAEIYDFSVGDEGYKRRWCDRVEQQFDCSIPLTARGRLAAMAYRGSTEAKRIVKSNEALLRAAKTIRRKLAGR